MSPTAALVHNNGLTLLNARFTPTNSARLDFGTAVHQEFPDTFQKRYPKAKFDSNVGPGQKGPDIEVSANAPFAYAELKPATQSGLEEFSRQMASWKAAGKRGKVAFLL
jgi:hypothetical protein